MEILYCSRCNRVVPPGGPDEGSYFLLGEDIICPKCYYQMPAEEHTGDTVAMAPKVEGLAVGSRIGPAVKGKPAKPRTGKIAHVAPGGPPAKTSSRLRAVQGSRAAARLAIALLVIAGTCALAIFLAVRARHQAPPDATGTGGMPSPTGLAPPRPGPETPRLPLPAPPPAPTPTPAPGGGLVLHWLLDDGGSEAADASGQGNRGAFAGQPAWVAGKPGKALGFDGADDAVSSGPLRGLAAGNAPHSIAAWVRVNALPAKRAWILLLGECGAGAHHWLIDKSGGAQLGAWNGEQLKPNLPVGEWLHLAATFDGKTLKAYVDGKPAGGIETSFDLRGVPLVLGRPRETEDFFNGAIRDVRVYSRALSAEEVAALLAPARAGS